MKTGFITTAGFQDMLRIRNEGRYDLYDLNLRYPEPLVARSDEILAVDEALHQLATEDRVAADLVKLRYFVGMTLEEGIKVLQDAGLTPNPVEEANPAVAPGTIGRTEPVADTLVKKDQTVDVFFTAAAAPFFAAFSIERQPRVRPSMAMASAGGLKAEAI